MQRTHPQLKEHLKMQMLSKKAIFIKEYEAVLASRVSKAYTHFCFDDEDSFEDEIYECMVEELAVLKSLRYVFRGGRAVFMTTVSG